MHNVITRLERRGLVERSPHPADARGVLVTITDEGRATVERTFPLIEQQVINRFGSHYSAEELDTMVEFLQQA